MGGSFRNVVGGGVGLALVQIVARGAIVASREAPADVWTLGQFSAA